MSCPTCCMERASSTPRRHRTNRANAIVLSGQRIYPIEEESIRLSCLDLLRLSCASIYKPGINVRRDVRSVAISGETIAECLPESVVASSFRSNRHGLNIFYIRCRVHPATPVSSFSILVELRTITQLVYPL